MKSFELDEHELEKAHQWHQEHLAKHHKGKEPYAGAIGGAIGYLISYTSLGTIVHIECSLCRHSGKDFKESDGCLTDFKDW